MDLAPIMLTPLVAPFASMLSRMIPFAELSRHGFFSHLQDITFRFFHVVLERCSLVQLAHLSGSKKGLPFEQIGQSPSKPGPMCRIGVRKQKNAPFGNSLVQKTETGGLYSSTVPQTSNTVVGNKAFKWDFHDCTITSKGVGPPNFKRQPAPKSWIES